MVGFFQDSSACGDFSTSCSLSSSFFLIFFYRRVLFLDVSWLASFSSLPLRKGGMCRVSRGKSSLPCKFGAFLSRVSAVHFFFILLFLDQKFSGNFRLRLGEVNESCFGVPPKVSEFPQELIPCGRIKNLKIGLDFLKNYNPDPIPRITILLIQKQWKVFGINAAKSEQP